MCEKSGLKCQNIDYDKFAKLTEGYTIGFLIQFLNRAIFYAHRNGIVESPGSIETFNNMNFILFSDTIKPNLNSEILLESLKTTNVYCLQGVNNNYDESKKGKKGTNHFPGLETAVGVFEEVLMWPIKYSSIFTQSPLRNQAGILLFGAPGTGNISKLLFVMS